MRYRYTSPTWTGRWRDTRREAQDYAVKAGAGWRDPLTGIFYENVLTTLETDAPLPAFLMRAFASRR